MMDITEKKEKGVELLHEFEHCAQASLCTYADELGFPVETLKRFAAAFGGGMATEEGNCGALVGAGMVLGLKKYKGPRIHEETVLLYNTFVEKEFDILFAESLDVECLARNKMYEFFHKLRGTIEVFAFDCNFFFLSYQFGSAAWARSGKFKRNGIFWPLLDYRVENLRNYITRALHHHSISHANVFFLDFVFVVESRTGNNHSADIDRCQLRHGCNISCSADLYDYVQNGRLSLLRRKFISY